MNSELSHRIWSGRYRYTDARGHAETSIAASRQRVAAAVAEAEPRNRTYWQQQFLSLLDGYRFLPGGRILAGAGTDARVTLFNCFVMGALEDSSEGIVTALREAALTLQQGGGIGCDFSPLRPHEMAARDSGHLASGPVSFMQVWETLCATIHASGGRQGAMMATLRCDHPDIEAFIDAKRQPGALAHFNLSVLLSDAFMGALEQDALWTLRFPQRGEAQISRTLRARALWQRLVQAAWSSAEPGVLFIDRINRGNNLYYRESIQATNPCGEVPLPPYGACNLGALNLVSFVAEPFSRQARFDFDGLAATARLATRFLDNVTDISRFPLSAQRASAHSTRRQGLGMTGLADALIMLGLRYDSEAARMLAQRIMRTICHSAYRASTALAAEKGVFAGFERDAYLAAPFIRRLPEPIRAAIARHGMRNSHLLAIAPAGTISLLAGNLSSGIEPVYALHQQRCLGCMDAGAPALRLDDYALSLWQHLHPGAEPPETFVCAGQIAPEAHLLMQAALQPCVDNAISKTINVPPQCDYDTFAGLYRRAYALGLKGCTLFRHNPVRSGVLVSADAADGAD